MKLPYEESLVTMNYQSFAPSQDAKNRTTSYFQKYV